VLDALRENFDEAVDGICDSIQNGEARMDALADEIKRLRDCMAKENDRIEAAKQVIADGIGRMVERAQGQKYGIRYQVKMQNNPPSAEIVDPDSVPDVFVSYKVASEMSAKEYEKFIKKNSGFKSEKKFDKVAIIGVWKASGDKQEAPDGTVVYQKKRVVIS
jgi:hypothetical protein